MSEDPNTNTNLNEADDLEGDLKEIYDLVRLKVKQIVANGKLTPEHLRPLILNVVEVIQEYTNDKYDHIDGSEKKAMALNIIRHVLKDLHNNGQIDNDSYEMIMLGLEFFGGALIDLTKVLYNKLVEVTADVIDNGCSGCFSRNCRKAKK